MKEKVLRMRTPKDSILKVLAVIGTVALVFVILWVALG
jgi:hypothetical protein